MSTTAVSPLVRFGDLLRERREKAGMSQRQLAIEISEGEPWTEQWWAEVERNERSIRRWEKNTIPRGAMAIKLARALGLLQAAIDTKEE